MVRLLREVVAPLIEADGGRLFLVEISESMLAIHLGGRYAGSPGTNLVRRRFIESAIRKLDPALEVHTSSGWVVPAGARPLVAEREAPEPNQKDAPKA